MKHYSYDKVFIHINVTNATRVSEGLPTYTKHGIATREKAEGVGAISICLGVLIYGCLLTQSNDRHVTLEALSAGNHHFGCVITKEGRQVKQMSEMVAYCGLHCDECKAFKATQTRDLEWKKQIAKHWSEQGEIKFQPEDVDCHGCKSDLISGFCRKLCDIRPCAREKKVETCAHCNEYPCKKLKDYLSVDPVATKHLEEIRKKLKA